MFTYLGVIIIFIGTVEILEAPMIALARLPIQSNLLEDGIIGLLQKMQTQA